MNNQVINEAEQFAVEVLLDIAMGNDKPLSLDTPALIELCDMILKLVTLARKNTNGIPA